MIGQCGLKYSLILLHKICCSLALVQNLIDDLLSDPFDGSWPRRASSGGTALRQEPELVEALGPYAGCISDDVRWKALSKVGPLCLVGDGALFPAVSLGRTFCRHFPPV